MGDAAAAAAGWGFGIVGTLGALCVGRGRGREYELGIGRGGDVTPSGWAGSRDDLAGDSPSSRFCLNFCDDFRGGGLGASGDGLFFFLVLLSFMSPPPSRTVELDDDDVKDSRTAARPWASALTASMSFDMLPVLLRLIGGLLAWAGSIGLILATDETGIRMGATSPGDCDEMEVGVVSRLYGPGPGDPENRVEGLPLKPLIWLLAPENKGVGGGRS